MSHPNLLADGAADVHPSDVLVEPELLTDDQAAAFLGVSVRTFTEKLRFVPWMPRPIVFGARIRRWSRSELRAAILAKAPRQEHPKGEPTQLLRGRIERAKRTGDFSLPVSKV